MAKTTSAPNPPLAGLINEKSGIRAEYAKRRLEYVVASVSNESIDESMQSGWELYKEGKTKSRLRKQKTEDVLLEDKAWCLLYRMGYPELNEHNFRVSYSEESGRISTKKLSVVARDAETLVVVECRSRESRGKKSLHKDIQQAKVLKKSLLATTRKHYGDSFKPKVLWLYVTNNIIWSETDVTEASENNIRIITENEMQYFDSFVKHMGPASRFQFLAEYFQGKDIPGLADIKLPATRGVFGKQRFYSFVSTPRQLLKIAFVNHLALNHPDGRPAYQRMITPSRIKQIQGFIEKGGYFPTNLLINFNEPCRFDLLSNKDNSDPNTKFGWLYLPRKYKSAWVIDGQHRLYGYSHLTGKHLDQPLLVIAFELMQVKDEAELFVTINHEQKSVPKSILVSLQADLKMNSKIPRERNGALASAIAKTLNSDPTSPFFQRCASQGVTSLENQSLTIPELVNGITRSGLLGRPLLGGNYIPGVFSGRTDEDTIARGRVMMNKYFDLLRNANPDRWEAARAGYISTNPGIRAHLQLLAECCRYLTDKRDRDIDALTPEAAIQEVRLLLKPVFEFIQSGKDDDIRELFSRKFGEGGVREYFENLCELVCKATLDFGDEALRVQLALRKDKRRSQANADVIELNQKIVDFVFSKLKQCYGIHETASGEKAYWELGVANSAAKSTAYTRKLEDKKNPQPMEAYLDLTHIKEIIKQSNNWALFQNVFNVQTRDERKGKTYYLDWMDTLNELRRIPAHPSGGRTYTEENYEFLKFIRSRVLEQISSNSGTTNP
jgi:DNA sulfur modification protein DndB